MQLLGMGYPESEVDDVLARMRREEEAQDATPASCGKSPQPQPLNQTEES
jgi:hypothetical protein